MARSNNLSLGNHIYLYRLLRDALGCGKQTFMPKVEEALEVERLGAADLGFDSTRELLEALDDCVELTVFKGGRIYATVIAQPAWDEALLAPEKKSGAGGKSWKKKKGDKALKAVKPRRVKREEPPAAQVGVVPEPATAAEPVAAPEPATAADTADAPCADDAVAAADLADVAVSGSASAADSAEQDATRIESSEAVAVEDADAELMEGKPVQDDAASAEVLEDRLRQEASTLDVEPSAEEGRPDISLTVIYDPDNANAGITTLELSYGEAVQSEKGETDVPVPEPEDRAAEELAANELPAACGESVEPSTVSVPSSEVPHIDDAASAPEAASPLDGEAPERPSARALAEYPHDFATEVHCPGPQLSLLARMLPFGCDIMRLLTEDFRIARGMGAVTGRRTWASFPLRYVHAEDNACVRVTVRKNSGFGMAWTLADVDGIDPTGMDAPLPELLLVEAGPWCSIDPEWNTEEAYLTSPRATFAAFVQFEDPDTSLRELASVAAPETWSYPEGASFAHEMPAFGMLYDYLALRFCRTLDLGQLRPSAEGSVRFVTGLYTAAMEPVVAVFEPQDSDIPWRYKGCVVSDAFEVPTQSAEIEGTGASAFVDERPLINDAGIGEDEFALAQRAVRYAGSNPRVATSVLYPPLGCCLFALPTSFTGGNVSAFVVDVDADDLALHLRALVRASSVYVLARAVSAEQPRWLVESVRSA